MIISVAVTSVAQDSQKIERSAFCVHIELVDTYGRIMVLVSTLH